MLVGWLELEWLHMFEYLISSCWNFGGRIRRYGLVGRGMSWKHVLRFQKPISFSSLYLLLVINGVNSHLLCQLCLNHFDGWLFLWGWQFREDTNCLGFWCFVFVLGFAHLELDHWLRLVIVIIVAGSAVLLIWVLISLFFSSGHGGIIRRDEVVVQL